MSFSIQLVRGVLLCTSLGVAAAACAHGSTLADGGAGGSGGTSSVGVTSGKAQTSTSPSATTNGTPSSTGSLKGTSNSAVTVQTVTNGPAAGPTVTTGATMMNACDTGQFGSLLTGATTAQQNICVACVQCSQSDQCVNEWNNFSFDPDAQSYQDCLTNCAGDSTCASGCASSYPTADSAYTAALSCSICGECTLNCDAADTCM